MQHAFLGYFWDIQVAEFNDTFLGEKYIGTLDVSVADFQVMEGLQSFSYLNEILPNFLLEE